MASLLASAGGEHARLRPPDRRDRLPAADLVLFFISLATRRIEYVACSSNPGGRSVTQQARNLAIEFADAQPFRFLIHDRGSKFGRAFDEVFRAVGNHKHRPHRALQLLPPNGRGPTPLTAPADLRRRDLLGGLIREDEAA